MIRRAAPHFGKFAIICPCVTLMLRDEPELT
jgi:hypothetical protein